MYMWLVTNMMDLFRKRNTGKTASPIILSDSSDNAEALSMYVSGNDVYVAGDEYNGAISEAKYWKNGNPIILASSSREATATSIFLK